MGKDDPLGIFGRHLHQDILDDVTSVADLVQTVLGFMTPAEREALRCQLSDILKQPTAGELKGKLNRASESLRFSSKQALVILQETLRQLERDASLQVHSAR